VVKPLPTVVTFALAATVVLVIGLPAGVFEGVIIGVANGLMSATTVIVTSPVLGR
jgi:hypothetical protein